ncbi:MAG TPA: hypothetical protein VL485_14475 [Ktedonobacteraceae bacterium]|nr:hypothetical protein [Ktedonobacteraceae bacterium]
MEQTPKDHAERKGYRKSPGRQYGYEYDPLYSRTRQPGGGQGEVPTQSGSLASRGATNHRTEALIQRPDPRRTRQLLRQNILASKSRPTDEPQDQEELYEEVEEAPEYGERRLSRSGHLSQPRAALTRNLGQTEEDEEELYDYADDPEGDYDEDPVDYSGRPLTSRIGQGLDRSRLPARASRNAPLPEYDDGYDEFEDDVYEEEEEVAPRKRKKKGGVTRRKLLFGLGVAAVGGAGIAGYELGPKLPQALGDVGTNIEQQLQEQFNKGLAQGAEAARKELISSLESLEGVSLNGAIEAAKLTRVAYDVFVSPVVKLSSQIAGNVLNAMLTAFKGARDWLGRINQDNATLAAIQTVLEAWVNQVNHLPKQLDTITQADLDGAQAYLRSLQAKIEEEKAKLNSPQGTPTPQQSPTARTTPTAKK